MSKHPQSLHAAVSSHTRVHHLIPDSGAHLLLLPQHWTGGGSEHKHTQQLHVLCSTRRHTPTPHRPRQEGATCRTALNILIFHTLINEADSVCVCVYLSVIHSNDSFHKTSFIQPSFYSELLCWLINRSRLTVG